MSRRRQRDSFPAVVEPANAVELIDNPEPKRVSDMTLKEAKRAAPKLGMLVLKGIDVQELKELGIDITGQNAIDVGRAVIMVAAASAHKTSMRCAERLDEGIEPEVFAKIADVQAQHLGHMIRAGETLSKPDMRPSAAPSDTPTLDTYDDAPVHLHQHVHLPNSQ